MSDTTVVPVSNLPEGEGAIHAYPGARQYVIIGIILVVLTSVEIGLYYAENLQVVQAVIWAINPMLITLSAMKFALVVMFYMHLRMDNRLFTALFLFGLSVAGALMVALIVLFMFAPVHAPNPAAIALDAETNTGVTRSPGAIQ
jgi:cytochrome c oxidase subunit 4